MKKRPAGKKIIGLTGGPGTGKSTVAAMFRRKGVRVIDADRIAHSLVAPGSAGYRAVVREFGSGILASDGRIDRRRLGQRIFSERRHRDKLNAILHPRIIRRIKAAANAAEEPIVVIDAPLLFETGLEKTVDTVIVVTASRRKQIERLKVRTGLSRKDILCRIAAQLPLKEKAGKADFVIDNNGTVRQTKEKMESIRRIIWKS